MKTTLYIKALFLTLGLMTTATTWGATAAFTGKVTAVKKAEAKKKDTLVYFTVKIDYFDYLSRGGGRDSKVGLDGSLVVEDLAVEFVGDFVFADRVLEVFPEVQADFRLTAEQSG